MSWGSGPWGETPWGGSLIIPPPPTPTDSSIVSVEVIASNMILVTFDKKMKSDSILTDIANYTITPEGNSTPVSVSDILVESSTPAVLEVLLYTTTMTVGETYTLAVSTSLRTSGGANLDGANNSSKFVGRLTKLDSMRNITKIFDSSIDSLLDKILAAISIEDDLLGGSRNDRL